MTLKIYDSIGREYDEDAIAKIREEIGRREHRRSYVCFPGVLTKEQAEALSRRIDAVTRLTTGGEPPRKYQWAWTEYTGPLYGPTAAMRRAAAAEERMDAMFGRTGRVWDHWWQVLAGIAKRARSAT